MVDGKCRCFAFSDISCEPDMILDVVEQSRFRQ